MRQRCSALIIAVTVLLMGAVHAQQPPRNPQARLETAVAEAIRLLEAQQNKVFLEKFMTTEDWKRVLKEDDTSKGAFTARFIEYLAPLALQRLKAVRGVTPTMSSDGGRATWRLDSPKSERPTLAFKRVSGLWYIEPRAE